jgi:hypothetical protein
VGRKEGLVPPKPLTSLSTPPQHLLPPRREPEPEPVCGTPVLACVCKRLARSVRADDRAFARGSLFSNTSRSDYTSPAAAPPVPAAPQKMNDTALSDHATSNVGSVSHPVRSGGGDTAADATPGAGTAAGAGAVPANATLSLRSGANHEPLAHGNAPSVGPANRAPGKGARQRAAAAEQRTKAPEGAKSRAEGRLMRAEQVQAGVERRAAGKKRGEEERRTAEQKRAERQRQEAEAGQQAAEAEKRAAEAEQRAAEAGQQAEGARIAEPEAAWSEAVQESWRQQAHAQIAFSYLTSERNMRLIAESLQQHAESKRQIAENQLAETAERLAETVERLADAERRAQKLVAASFKAEMLENLNESMRRRHTEELAVLREQLASGGAATRAIGAAGSAHERDEQASAPAPAPELVPSPYVVAAVAPPRPDSLVSEVVGLLLRVLGFIWAYVE